MFNLKEIQPPEALAAWSAEQLDAFMEMYLDKVRMEVIAQRLGRSLASVRILPWKLATAYMAYTPLHRGNRAGTPWCKRSREIWRLGTGPAAEARGVTQAYLGELLGRAAGETPIVENNGESLFNHFKGKQ